MAGTHEGGVKAAATNKRINGADYYRRLGAKGGRNGHGGGFASMNKEDVARCGRRGGSKSVRSKAISKETKAQICSDYILGLFTMKEIASRHKVSVASVAKAIKEMSLA